MQNIASWSEWL